MTPVVVTPCFAPARLVVEMLGRLYAAGPPDARHWLLHNHYPCNGPAEVAWLRSFCGSGADRWQLAWHDSGGDHGCHESLNRWAAAVGRGWPDEQVVITHDADAWVRPGGYPGWVEAIVRAFAADKSLAVVAARVAAVDARRHEWSRRSAGGVRLVELPSVEMFHACGWRWDVVRAVGGWQEPYRYYGGIEGAMVPKFRALGMGVAWLEDYRDEFGLAGYAPELFDRDYLDWKAEHLRGDGRSFGEWLSGRVRS